MLVVVDDEDRENEGDLTVAAELVTPEIINFMAVQGRGLICLALSPERCDALHLPLMTPRNTSKFGTAFCESIDARHGVTTGISAADRALSIRVAMDPASGPEDLARPGHVFPLRAREGGVLVRAGQTEAAVDLARLAGLSPGGVICEVMNEDGTMARVPQLQAFCRLHGLKMISVAELIRYRLRNDHCIRRAAESWVDTDFGRFKSILYTTTIDRESHLALVLGDLAGAEGVLVRVQTRCTYGDVFASKECDCGKLLRASLDHIARQGAGVLVYLHNSGGDSLAAHPPDFMHYTTVDGQKLLQYESGVGAQILSDLGLHTVRLMTNHPRKIVALEGFGISILEQIPVAV